MDYPSLLVAIEGIARSLEVIAVLIIAVSFVHALGRALVRLPREGAAVHTGLRAYLGRSLLRGLEFLVAADIIRTVTMDMTLENLRNLALLAGMRIVLGWSVGVEIEGCWPWKVAERDRIPSREPVLTHAREV